MANPRGTPENLRPFPKGTSGNPSGRPRGPKLSTLIAQELEKPTVPGSEVTKAKMVAARLVNLAEAGDISAIKEVIDRLEGKSVARNESGAPGEFTGLEDVPTSELLKLAKRQA